MKTRIALPANAAALAIAAALSLLAHPAQAQSTTGSIFGQVAANGGETVLIKSTTGIARTVPVDSHGRYNAGELPLGT
ncbi:hypothetical protein [Dyella sedimenti]|uniref:hypothetical protein n=1 Tax=Dyella sedimenti TaxID=2919947 RepID=UPI001FA942FC|nr:hypothetical protein [Dyella sedimenti]